MELKFEKNIIKDFTSVSSNRTFMELKLTGAPLGRCC